jgi:hypothetical protein
MKSHLKHLTFLALIAIIFASCEGETGPQGPVGPEGPQGAPGESGFVFEWENVNFTSPDYEVFLDFPLTFEGLDSDVALVYFLWDVQTDGDGNYFLWDVQTDGDGNPLDVWRQLPQTVLHENGLLIYNFDHTKVDVRLFLSADFDMSTLSAIDTDEWVVRVVVIPANYWNSRMDIDA